MPIKCNICNKQFDKIISSTHLKQHSITSSEYKTIYGDKSLASDEYRQLRSDNNKGKNNPNYGNKMSDESKLTISSKNSGKIPWNKDTTLEDTSIYINAAKKREERYLSGELTRYTQVHSEETKLRISLGVSRYAETHGDELSIRGHKAIETQRKAGNDLAHFRGRKHTQYSKDLISVRSKEANQIKSKNAQLEMLERIHLANLTLLSGFDDSFLQLRCNICDNEFEHTHQMFQPSKFTTDRCNICYPVIANRSYKEIEIYEYIKTLCPDAIPNYKFLKRNELDIFIPSLNIGIEFNGLYWHSEKVLEYNGRSKLADFEKYKKVTDLGIRLISIFEDEWENKKEIVKSRLYYILRKSTNNIYARKCQVMEIDTATASSFCKEYHIQGHGRTNARFGLFYQNELVAVMTFSKNNLSRKVNEWELNRFCTTSNTSIVGGASKLFNAFTRLYNPPTVITYADQRWSNGNLYSALNFKLDSISSPGYWYVYPNEIIRHHRFSLRKNKNDNPELTEWQNRQDQGWDRIWDCGNSKWRWNNTLIV